MKLMSTAAVAAIALVGISGTAQAQSHTTYSSTYSVGGDVTLDGAGAVLADGTFNLVQIFGGDAARKASGTRFHQHATAPNDVGTADASANANKQTFTLTGTVNKDCSFYGGGSSAHTIALNTIGIRTQSSDNVSQAFNQAQDISANFNTATAGCNTKNTVEISTAHNGRLTNGQPGAYDNTQFTAEIPYGLNATWTGVDTGVGAGTATTQQIKWDAGQPGAGSKTGGAWRSAFNVDIVAPAQPKGLVAGTYEDTITVTLAAAS